MATMEVQWIVILAAIAGSFAATMYPYWSRLRDEHELIFEKKFLASAIWSFVTSAAIALALFPTLLEQAEQATTGTSLVSIFAVTALAAYGLNRGSNELMHARTITTPSKVAVSAARKALAEEKEKEKQKAI